MSLSGDGSAGTLIRLQSVNTPAAPSGITGAELAVVERQRQESTLPRLRSWA